MTRPGALLGLAVLGVAGAAGPASAQQPIELRPGLVLTRSVRIIPKRYRLAAPASLDSAVITIRGSNLTVDLTGAELLGQDPSADPDRASGVAIRIEGGHNVRVIGGRIRGYKIGLLAHDTRGLELRDIDASNNWKPRLYSVVEHESLADWLSFHHNEKAEWLRYGAAFYLDGVHGGVLRRNQAMQGMNGLLLVRSDSLHIQDNDFSFNSGLGIGLYRSSGNRIIRNRIDYDVRGYSHRFYHRGQDSAGLLLYEQSSHNLVAFNSATHGGDGLFLWAGQSTMDTGEGGANDNVFYGNDFSFAPANSMEATFSRNSFLANRAEGSDYGLWGGYSFESVVAGNCFLGNRTGVAIEHGQDNAIVANLLAGDTTALNFWGDPIEPSDWGYPKHRDTKSRDYRVAGNVFSGNRVAVRVRNTAGLAVTENRFLAVDSMLILRDTSGYGFVPVSPDSSAPRPPASLVEPCGAAPAIPPEFAYLVPALPGVPRSAPASVAARKDRSAIIVDDWGPFDWRSPKLWPLDSVRTVPLRLQTLGPPGQWRVVERRGIATLSASSGAMGDTLTVQPLADSLGEWELELEYLGGATVSPRGARLPTGRPYRFGYARFEPKLDWAARFFAWTDSTDVRRGPEGFAVLTRETPIMMLQVPRLDYEWYRPTVPGLPRARWALEATATALLPEGNYSLRAISDDGIRLWVDGVLKIDNWVPHESAVDAVPLSGGRHELKVQYYQVDGWTELRVEILRTPTP